MIPLLALGAIVLGGAIYGASSSATRRPRRRGRVEPAWQRAERLACERRGFEHVGGPGREDCDGGNVLVEVKHWNRPVDLAAVKKAHARAAKEGKSAEVVSGSGFTIPAVEWASRRQVKLSLK